MVNWKGKASFLNFTKYYQRPISARIWVRHAARTRPIHLKLWENDLTVDGWIILKRIVTKYGTRGGRMGSCDWGIISGGFS